MLQTALLESHSLGLRETTTRLDEDDVWNSFPQIPLIDFVKSEHPRLLFVGYGEIDNWGHSGRYDLVLESAHQFDHLVQQLWETMQSMPEYHDRTTFIITTDHGRGGGLEEWKEHVSTKRDRRIFGLRSSGRIPLHLESAGTFRLSHNLRLLPRLRHCWARTCCKARPPQLRR